MEKLLFFIYAYTIGIVLAYYDTLKDIAFAIYIILGATNRLIGMPFKYTYDFIKAFNEMKDKIK